MQAENWFTKTSFEYKPWDKSLTVDDYFMNTGQALMNWMVFENSPVWYWIHALKPVTNIEATGYSLGFWRPAGEFEGKSAPGDCGRTLGLQPIQLERG